MQYHLTIKYIQHLIQFYSFWGSVWVLCNVIPAFFQSTTVHSSGISAWSVQAGQYGTPTYSLQPNHLSFTTTFLFVYLLIVHLFWNCKHSLLSFIILWPYTSYPNSQSCGFHTLFSSIIYEHIHCHTHKHMRFLCQYTASTSRVSEVERLFLRSAEVLW